LTHCIQSSTGPDWAPFTPFLPADHPILFLNDQKYWRQKARLKTNNWYKLMILQHLFDQSRLLKSALQLDLLYQPKANCLATCVTSIGCPKFLSHNCWHQRLHNPQSKDVSYTLAPLEDTFCVHMHMGQLISYKLDKMLQKQSHPNFNNWW
jgi:hypothetical protein